MSDNCCQYPCASCGGLYLPGPEREVYEKLDKVKDTLAECPVCKSKRIDLSAERVSAGMDGGYYDYRFGCENCGMTLRLPADDFYGRDFYTFEEAVDTWNSRSWFKEES